MICWNKLLIFAALSALSSASSIWWNVDSRSTISDLQQAASAERPLIVFRLADFSLKEFSKAASAYVPNSDGGKLPHVKNWIKQSQGFLISDDDVSDQSFVSNSKSIYYYTEGDDLSKLSDRPVIVALVNSWDNLDAAVDKIVSAINTKSPNYIAVLTTANSLRRKKRADPPKKPATPIFVETEGDCMLYAKSITFVKRSDKGKTEIQITGDPHQPTVEGDCINRNGTFTMKFNNPYPSKAGNSSLTNLTLTFHIRYRHYMSWWDVDSMSISVKGPVIDGGETLDAFFNGSSIDSLAIGGSTTFNFACSELPTLYFSKDNKKTIYGLQFKNLQIQPFKWKRYPGNFTDDVNDCVPFFSIGIWMFLVVAGVLLLIVFFGIGMISSLKTMDRFDDPKGKPLVISARE